MRSLVVILVLCLLLQGADRGGAQVPQAIDVQVVKYDGLKDVVLKNRGKVVIVDFWSTTCIPCIKNFKHMVEMNKRLAKEGLVSITVSLDPLGEGEKPEDRKARVLKVLRIKEVNFINLILDEPLEFVEKKLRIVKIPSVYVFSRQGQWIHFSSDEGPGVSTEAVEKLAVKWLQEK
jgi:thiol-disulfide isomerase/thioredoxin